MALRNSGIYFDGMVANTPPFMHIRFDADPVSHSLRCRSALRCKDGVIYPWNILVPEDPTSLRGVAETIPLTRRQVLTQIQEQIASELAKVTLEEL